MIDAHPLGGASARRIGPSGARARLLTLPRNASSARIKFSDRKFNPVMPKGARTKAEGVNFTWNLKPDAETTKTAAPHNKLRSLAHPYSLPSYSWISSGAARRPLSTQESAHRIRYCLRGRPRPRLMTRPLMTFPLQRCGSKTTIFPGASVIERSPTPVVPSVRGRTRGLLHAAANRERHWGVREDAEDPRPVSASPAPAPRPPRAWQAWASGHCRGSRPPQARRPSESYRGLASALPRAGRHDRAYLAFEGASFGDGVRVGPLCSARLLEVLSSPESFTGSQIWVSPSTKMGVGWDTRGNN